MRERRSTRRITLDHPLILTIGDQRVRTRLLNLSKDGALLRNEQDRPNMLGDAYLGKEATFLLKPKGKPARTYTGEIIRLYYRDTREYIALRFWSKDKGTEA